MQGCISESKIKLIINHIQKGKEQKTDLPTEHGVDKAPVKNKTDQQYGEHTLNF